MHAEVAVSIESLDHFANGARGIKDQSATQQIQTIRSPHRHEQSLKQARLCRAT